MSASRVLVTGGNGFLGRSVVRGLVTDPGLELVVGTDLGLPETATPGAVHEIVDVTDPDRVAEAIAGHGIDTVVHLASIVNPGRDMSDAVAHRVDVDGTRNVVAACLAHGVNRIVVSSSGAAYGYHPDNPAWITEEQPVRGNDVFAYSRHKRLVEELLADTRRDHPALQQVILRIGTILGRTVDNQITDLLRRRRLLKIAGADSPFVFIWDDDLVAIVLRAVTGDVTGVFNVAGDGAMTIDEIARTMGRSTIAVPEGLLRAALTVARPLRLSQYGPEQTMFLRYRPVLDNSRLKDVFGYVPELSTREAFEAWYAAHPGPSDRP